MSASYDPSLKNYKALTKILSWLLDLACLFCVGSVAYHECGSAAGIELKAGTWSVEYTRGFIPSTFAVMFVDTLFGTLDFMTAFRAAHLYTKALLFEAGYYMTHVKELFG